MTESDETETVVEEVTTEEPVYVPAEGGERTDPDAPVVDNPDESGDETQPDPSE